MNSMSDLFHEDVSDDFIDMVWIVMGLAAQHTFQILTKRPERMLEWATKPTSIERLLKAMKGVASLVKDSKLPDIPSTTIQSGYWYAHNAWLGVSVENQYWADKRIPLLLQTPAAVRFLSVEPLLKAVGLSNWMPSDYGWSSTFTPLDGIERNDIDGNPCAGLDWIIVGGESGPKARPMNPDWVRRIRDDCQAASVPFFFKQWGGPRSGGEALLDGKEHREFPGSQKSLVLEG